MSQRKHSVTLIFTFVKQRNIYCQPNIFKSPNNFCPLTDVVFTLPSLTAGITQSPKLQAKLVKACDQRESQYARVDIWLSGVGCELFIPAVG